MEYEPPQCVRRGVQKFQWCEDARGVKSRLEMFGDAGEVGEFERAINVPQVMVVDSVHAVRLMEASCDLGKKSVGADADVDAHPITNFIPDALFDLAADLLE